ncbi:tetratricopeptide repeat protein, partial [candidate division KSB1 bacterium]
YSDLISRFPGDDFCISAADRILDITIGNITDEVEKLNTGLQFLNGITSESNSVLSEFLNYKKDELTIMFSAETDSVTSAFGRIAGITLDGFEESIQEKILYRLTVTAFKKDDYTNTVEYSRRYMTKYPKGMNSPEIRYTGAAALYNTGDKVTSKLWIDALNDSYYYSSYSDLGRILEGDIYNWGGNYEEALNVYKREIIRYAEISPDKDILTALYWKTAKAEENNYNFTNAADYYRLYIELVEDLDARVRGYYALANSLFELEKYQDGLAELGKVILDGAGTQYELEAKIKEAEVFIRMEDYKTAQEKYEGLVKLELPDTSLVKFEYRRLMCLYRQDLRRQANNERNDFERKYRNLPEELQDYYKGLLRVEEGNVHYRNFHLSPDKFEQAEDIYKDVINDYPGTRQAQYAELYRGVALLTQNELEDGLPLLREFDARHPDSPYLYNVYRYLGLWQFTSEQYSNAFLSLNKAVNTAEGKRDSTVHKHYIEAGRMSGFQDVTLSAIRTYLKRFPDAPDRINQLWTIGDIYKEQERYDEAIAHFNNYIKEADPVSELDFQMSIAECYYLQKKYSIALAEYFKILKYGVVEHPYAGAQFNLTMKYNIADCFEKIGMYDMALKYLDEIIQQEGADSVFSKQANEVKDRIMRIKRDLDKDD